MHLLRPLFALGGSEMPVHQRKAQQTRGAQTPTAKAVAPRLGIARRIMLLQRKPEQRGVQKKVPIWAREGCSLLLGAAGLGVEDEEEEANFGGGRMFDLPVCGEVGRGGKAVGKRKEGQGKKDRGKRGARGRRDGCAQCLAAVVVAVLALSVDFGCFAPSLVCFWQVLLLLLVQWENASGKEQLGLGRGEQASKREKSACSLGNLGRARGTLEGIQRDLTMRGWPIVGSECAKANSDTEGQAGR